MDSTNPASVAGSLAVTGHAILPLVLQLAVSLALLVGGVFAYTRITPFRELTQIRDGNVAAATLLSGAVVSLAIPLAALLATTGSTIDIIVWGIVAILLQLATVALAYRLAHGVAAMIVAGSMAAALPLVAMQLAVGLLNAAAMVPV